MSNGLTGLPETMTVIEITEFGGPEVLKPVKRALPAPAANEVLIRNAAAGINRPEVLQRKGFYPPPPGATDIPGLEAAGTIAAVGGNVKDWAPGDKVCALLPGGGYGEYATVDAGSCLPVPEGLSFEEAAALPETVFTVWANVFDDAQLNDGETLLVHGGTSGIGAMAIAMARAAGARVIATAGSAGKVEAALKLGADAAYNYKEDAWDDAIIKNGGADVVLDMAGGDFYARNIVCLKPHGRHVSIAFLRGPSGEVNIMALMQKRLRLSGSTMKARPPEEKARLARAIRKTVWPWIEAGKVRPRIDAVFPLEEAGKAHEHMESGAHIGKIVLKIV